MDNFAQYISLIFFFLSPFIVLFAYLYRRHHERERTEQLKATAAQLGWQFIESPTFEWIPNLEKFSLFTRGRRKQISNMMYGEMEGIKAALFDYQYTVGSGRSQHTYFQSVAYFEPKDMSLPSFSLRPEGIFQKLAQVFGYQDIDFGQRPLFSKKYLLRGADEQGIRNSFSEGLLAFYETNPGLSTDGGGAQLFIFRESVRVKPPECQTFLNGALTLCKMFAHRW